MSNNDVVESDIVNPDIGSVSNCLIRKDSDNRRCSDYVGDFKNKYIKFSPNYDIDMGSLKIGRLEKDYDKPEHYFYKIIKQEGGYAHWYTLTIMAVTEEEYDANYIKYDYIPITQQCAGVTKAGNRCKKTSYTDDGFCNIHYTQKSANQGKKRRTSGGQRTPTTT